MKIGKLHIENFRSIDNLTLQLGALNGIVGPNGSGKSNILKAIDLAIGEGWTTKAKVAQELFRVIQKPIKIALTFDLPIEFCDRRGYDVSIISLELEMTFLPELSAKTTINGGKAFYAQDQFKRLCHFIYVPSERQLAGELRVSQWTMLGKLMRVVHDHYLEFYQNDPGAMRDAFEKAMAPAKKFLERDFSKDPTAITYYRFVETFKRHCATNSYGLASGFEPILNIYNLNWFYKTLQIHVKEEIPERSFDNDEVGAGMQNLLMLSIFQTYSELMGGTVIFGIEEPEIYLYPSAQRALFKTLQELSGSTQLFYTTHNPNFVDAARPDDLVLVRKSKTSGTYVLRKDATFSTSNADKEIYRIYTHFNPERNEIFFARRIILVEGDSDRILVATLAKEKWGLSLDALGVAVISCGGKGGVIYFVGVCRLAGIEDYIAIWDSDGDADDRFKLLEDSLRKGKGLQFVPCMERQLGLPDGDGAAKVRNAHQWASSVSPSEFPSFFLPLKDFVAEKTVVDERRPVESANSFEDDIPF